jgi:hypothetical protein
MNMDVEMVNYSNGEFRRSNNLSFFENYSNENRMIDTLYRRVFNVRTGMELAVTPVNFVRLGYAHYGRVFSNDHKNDAKGTHFFTGGIGYRKGRFLLDVAVMHQMFRNEYYAFDVSQLGLPMEGNKAVFKQRNWSAMITLGLRFE